MQGCTSALLAEVERLCRLLPKLSLEVSFNNNTNNNNNNNPINNDNNPNNNNTFSRGSSSSGSPERLCDSIHSTRTERVNAMLGSRQTGTGSNLDT